MTETPLGPTGGFPLGKFHDDDEGELRFGIGIIEDAVILHFGKKVEWIGLDREVAIRTAATIEEQALKLPGQLTIGPNVSFLLERQGETLMLRFARGVETLCLSRRFALTLVAGIRDLYHRSE